MGYSQRVQKFGEQFYIGDGRAGAGDINPDHGQSMPALARDEAVAAFPADDPAVGRTAMRIPTAPAQAAKSPLAQLT